MSNMSSVVESRGLSSDLTTLYEGSRGLKSQTTLKASATPALQCLKREKKATCKAEDKTYVEFLSFRKKFPCHICTTELINYSFEALSF